MDQAYEPISIGYSCEVKYQLSRTLYMRRFPDGDETDLRNMLLTSERSQRSFRRHIFDWQITPFAAVLTYLEADFQGVFEREDLHVVDGEVAHRTLSTRHPHEFHAIDGVLDDAAIDAGYPAARAKFEHLASRFRAHLLQPGPFLYVCKEIRVHEEAVRLMDLLRARNPDHALKLLFVGYDGEDQNLDGLRGQAFKAWVPLESGKPADRAWEGDNPAWDALLQPWSLTIHGGGPIPRTHDDVAPPKTGAAQGVLGAFADRIRRWARR
jgi:hypothetical protein